MAPCIWGTLPFQVSYRCMVWEPPAPSGNTHVLATSMQSTEQTTAPISGYMLRVHWLAQGHSKMTTTSWTSGRLLGHCWAEGPSLRQRHTVRERRAGWTQGLQCKPAPILQNRSISIIMHYMNRFIHSNGTHTCTPHLPLRRVHLPLQKVKAVVLSTAHSCLMLASKLPPS